MGFFSERAHRGQWLAWASALFFFAALCAVNAVRVSLAGPAGYLQHLETTLFGVAFFVVWLAFFGRVWPAVALAVLLFAWWWPAELFLRLEYRAPLSPQFVGMALESNAGELREFAVTFWRELAVGLVLLCAISVPALVLCYRYPVRWSHRSRWWCLLVFPAAGALTYGAYQLQEPEWLKPTNDPFRSEPLAFWSDKWREVFPLTLPLALKRIGDDTQRVAQMRKQVAGFKFGASSEGKPLDAVVLVIGESSRADRWRLNGYARQTNPLLERRANLVFFSDVVTRSVATRLAVPFILARKPVLSPDGAINAQPEPSLIAAFNEAGYRSAWLSNQSASGFWDTSTAFYTGDATTVRFLNPSTAEYGGSYDEVLVEPFAALLHNRAPMMVVVHTMGSHFNYANRYPPQFDRFQPSLTGREHELIQAGADQTGKSNSYDNTILYTDYVLDQLIGQLNGDGRRSVLAYVSDHGEDVNDAGCKTQGVRREGRWSYRVPALMWMSDTLAREKPEVLERLRARSREPIQTDAMFQMLMHVAGVRMPDSADAAPRGLRMVVGNDGHWVDFDQAERQDACHIRANAR